MNPIRPHDVVRLRHTPECWGVVEVLVDDLTLVDFGDTVLSWVPLEFLELVPDENEELLAA